MQWVNHNIRHLQNVCLQHQTPEYSCITNPNHPKVKCAPPSLHYRNKEFWAFPGCVLDVLPPLQWWQMWVFCVSSEAHPRHSLRSVSMLGPTCGISGAVPWLGELAPQGAWQGGCPAAPGHGLWCCWGDPRQCQARLGLQLFSCCFPAVVTNACVSKVSSLFPSFHPLQHSQFRADNLFLSSHQSCRDYLNPDILISETGNAECSPPFK